MKRAHLSWRLNLGFLAFLLFVGFLAGCKTRPNPLGPTGPGWREFIALMPDSLKANPFGDHSGFKLSPEQIQLLNTDLEVADGGDTWRIFDADSSWFTRLERTGRDEGLHYDFIDWRQGRKSWLLIVQALGDHCCNFSRLALYEVQGQNLIDRSATGLPTITWNAFFKPETLAGLDLEPMKGNRYPLSINITGNPPKLEVNLVAEYLSLNYEEAVGEKLLQAFPAGPLILEWNGKAFEWKQ